MRVAIVGQGYVGTALGLAASNAGHRVVGIETSPRRIEILKAEVPYEVSDNYELADGSDVVVIAVPTPLDSKRTPDLSHLESACNSLRSSLKEKSLIVNESTSYPGTLRNFIAPRIGDRHLFASAPERVDPGNTVWNIGNTPRLISGTTAESTTLAIEFYRTICSTVIPVSSPEVAEAAKLFENTFRQVNIALVNEFAEIAHALGISASEVIDAAATKPFGFMPFLPSLGVGGHCIPVDPSYLSFVASKVGADASFIDLANKVNSLMPTKIASRIESMLEVPLKGSRIQVVGISYKADVSDTRESPSIELIRILREKGAEVSWHDPMVKHYLDEQSQELSLVDLGVIATAHSGVDYSLWKQNKIPVIDISTRKDSGWAKFL